ncbi:MAG: hypothetical protein IT384_17570 [Deltaproteobacteria bacterium]|nr:hypothetical protein [Deltaproteobacteria bacterium]
MAANGIASLITVTQLKADNANEEALHGADKQRELIKEMKDLRAQQRAFDDKIRDKVVTDAEYWQIKAMLDEAGLDNKNWDGEYDGMLGHYDEGHSGEVGHWKAKLGTEGQEKANQDLADATKNQFQDAIKDFEAQDKLGNFEIQDLMSTYNQAETLASSVLKKRDDTGNAVIGKV